MSDAMSVTQAYTAAYVRTSASSTVTFDCQAPANDSSTRNQPVPRLSTFDNVPIELALVRVMDRPKRSIRPWCLR